MWANPPQSVAAGISAYRSLQVVTNLAAICANANDNVRPRIVSDRERAFVNGFAAPQCPIKRTISPLPPIQWVGHFVLQCSTISAHPSTIRPAPCPPSRRGGRARTSTKSADPHLVQRAGIWSSPEPNQNPIKNGRGHVLGLCFLGQACRTGAHQAQAAFRAGAHS